MPRLRTLISALLFVGAFLLAGRVSAQTVVIANKTSLARYGTDGALVGKRTVNPESINYDDCFANQSLELSYTAGGYTANQTLQVWAGNTDCKPISARSGSTQQCWRPYGNLPNASTGTIRIPIRDILNARKTDSSAPSSVAPATVCQDIALTTYSLYFMWFQGTATDPIGTTDQVDLQVKTQGPTALTGVKVLPGNTRVIVTWDALGEAGTTDQSGVRVFCDDSTTSKAGDSKVVCADASTTSTDAGDADTDATTSDASVDAGCTTVTDPSTAKSCTSSNLVSTSDGGKTVLPDSKFQCFSLSGNIGSRAVVETFRDAPLTNDRTYAVAVAAVDSYGNVGSLSEVTCATPGATTDFWQLYRDSGGQAGGCSSTEGAPLSSLVTVVPFVAMLGAWIRRRRRSSAR
jgi:MYXO-CTERM domain-containing protein